MERLKLPKESRELLIHAGVKFEYWLLERACESGRPAEKIMPADFERLFSNLTVEDLLGFIQTLHLPGNNSSEKRKAA